LLLGDVILRFGGAGVVHAQDLMGALSAERIGVAMPLQLLRAGALHEASVTVGERG
jgi:S1-C subfamily serine protease